MVREHGTSMHYLLVSTEDPGPHQDREIVVTRLHSLSGGQVMNSISLCFSTSLWGDSLLCRDPQWPNPEH